MAFTTIEDGDPLLAEVIMGNFKHVNYGAPLLPTNADGESVNGAIDIGDTTHAFRNAYIQILTLSNQARCDVYKTGSGQSIPSHASTFQLITWDAEALDARGMHDNSSNPGRVTVPEAGTYLIIPFVMTNVVESGEIYIQKTTGASDTIMGYGGVMPQSSSKSLFHMSQVVTLAESDYVTIWVRQLRGDSASVDVLPGSNVTRLTVVKLF